MELSESYPILKAVLLAHLKARMLKGEIVRFVYIKKDGTLRTAVGTLQTNAVQANVTGSGRTTNKELVSYIDLEKMQWRSFRKENFVGIID